MEDRIKKIAMFIDGTFFLKVNSYYRYHHERKSTLNFNGLSEFIRDEVSKLENSDKRYCQVVEIHWFRGRYSTSQLEKKYPDDAYRLTQMTNERRIDDIFMYESIVSHNYPLLVDTRTGEAEEKGIDVWFSLETYELTSIKHFDVVVLIAGDTDYVPLIRKLNGLGARVMVLGWDFSYETTSTAGRNYKVTTRTSQALIDECVYPIMMDKRIDDRTSKNDPIVNALFNV
ncbi:MAG TPA: NYN domain-containing protein [Bacteroidales bacterium]|nr:NYN domain-containing protein [Bacteroidales bacterium]